MTTHIKADMSLCQGHGLCYFESDELFDLRDDDGKVIILKDPVPDHLISAAEAGVRVCPERALWIARDEQ